MDDVIINPMQQVRIVGAPGKVGLVISVDEVAGLRQYTVFVDNAPQTFFSGQILPLDMADDEPQADKDDLLCGLTAFQINNPSSDTLYSLNSAKIEFVPYQFRPALKILKADEPRILIADSVGVGKTIEAGLIVKELEAQKNIERIVVICPKPLVSEEKWKNEMKRFDERFEHVDKQTLYEIIDDTDRDGVWPARYNKVIIPYSILDGSVYDAQMKGKRIAHKVLPELDPEPHFDLVIVDEAHHIRNGSIEKEKAFAYKCVKYFCDRADAVVMLTATPLQTSDNDLYTLLNVLRPDLVVNREVFDIMSRPNQHVANAVRAIREEKDGWQEAALKELGLAEETHWGREYMASNPVYRSVRAMLAQGKISPSERVQLISDVESLHSFDLLINRTRRKDIQDFCIRRPHTVESRFTLRQSELHDAVLEFEESTLSVLHDARSVPFMTSTIKRQAASCIFGLAPLFEDIVNRRLDQILDDAELPEGDASAFARIFRERGRTLLAMARELPDEDPKYEAMLGAVREIQARPQNKVILFSCFRHTLAYVRGRLEKDGYRVSQIDGSVPDEIRREIRRRFSLPREDGDAYDILLFTEVGSEGLDYQFCDTMINYDLPWNPMRIEQRIGRIDRRGQKSEVVHIYNIITAGTVDAEIYERCLLRIGIFERSVGECDAILGEIGSALEKIAMSPELTAEERDYRLRQLADNEVRKLQEMNRLEESQKDLFGFDLASCMANKEIERADNPWISPASIQILLRKYLEKRLGHTRQCLFGQHDQTGTLRLSFPDRQLLLEDLRKLTQTGNASSSILRQPWDLYLKGQKPNHLVTFVPREGQEKPESFLLNPTHPFVRQAAAAFAGGGGPMLVHLRSSSEVVEPGSYAFAIYAWRYTGPRAKTQIVCFSESDEVAEDISGLIRSGSTDSARLVVHDSRWHALDAVHVERWGVAKERYVESVRERGRYRIQCLENGLRLKKRSLSRDDENTDARILRMHESELRSAERECARRIAEIQAGVGTADIHTVLLARGVVEVSRGGCNV